MNLWIQGLLLECHKLGFNFLWLLYPANTVVRGDLLWNRSAPLRALYWKSGWKLGPHNDRVFWGGHTDGWNILLCDDKGVTWWQLHGERSSKTGMDKGSRILWFSYFTLIRNMRFIEKKSPMQSIMALVIFKIFSFIILTFIKAKLVPTEDNVVIPRAFAAIVSCQHP